MQGGLSNDDSTDDSEQILSELADASLRIIADNRHIDYVDAGSLFMLSTDNLTLEAISLASGMQFSISSPLPFDSYAQGNTYPDVIRFDTDKWSIMLDNQSIVLSSVELMQSDNRAVWLRFSEQNSNRHFWVVMPLKW